MPLLQQSYASRATKTHTSQADLDGPCKSAQAIALTLKITSAVPLPTVTVTLRVLHQRLELDQLKHTAAVWMWPVAIAYMLAVWFPV